MTLRVVKLVLPVAVAVVPPNRCAASDAVSKIERKKVNLATVAFILPDFSPKR